MARYVVETTIGNITINTSQRVIDDPEMGQCTVWRATALGYPYDVGASTEREAYLMISALILGAESQ